ncbi:MAG: hypothetical protein EHM49_09065 [Deltaproteobacteria bacterium]|nr:MAG: hypothetical protein EHM49_09065 [Deltaproteobacteria bacterium]
MQEGWVCPKCGRVLAPWVAECDCTYIISTPQPTTDPGYTQTGDPLPPRPITICNHDGER